MKKVELNVYESGDKVRYYHVDLKNSDVRKEKAVIMEPIFIDKKSEIKYQIMSINGKNGYDIKIVSANELEPGWGDD